MILQQLEFAYQNQLEESIARIIDIDAWIFYDHCIRKNFSWIEAKRGTRSSIRKARRILQLLKDQKS